MLNSQEIITIGFEAVKHKLGIGNEETLLELIGELTCDLPEDFRGFDPTKIRSRAVKGTSGPGFVSIGLRKHLRSLTYYHSYKIGDTYAKTSVELTRDPNEPKNILGLSAERREYDEMNDQGSQVAPQDKVVGTYEYGVGGDGLSLASVALSVAQSVHVIDEHSIPAEPVLTLPN